MDKNIFIRADHTSAQVLQHAIDSLGRICVEFCSVAAEHPDEPEAWKAVINTLIDSHSPSTRKVTHDLLDFVVSYLAHKWCEKQEQIMELSGNNSDETKPT